MVQERFAGKPIPDPGFAGDGGAPPPALAAALQAYAADGSRDGVHAALADARLLVPVVAVLDEAVEGPDGLPEEKDSHMATVTLTNPDGRRGLLAFTSTAALAAWRADARPVPADTRRVVLAALQEHADAVLLDIAGPVPFPVEGYALRRLATGEPFQPPHQDPELATAVLAALAALPGPPRVRLLPGDPYGTDLAVQVGAGDAGPGLVEQVGERLAAVEALQLRCPRGVAVLSG